MREQKFNDNTVDAFIAEFRETVGYARLGEGGILPEDNDDKSKEGDKKQSQIPISCGMAIAWCDQKLAPSVAGQWQASMAAGSLWTELMRGLQYLEDLFSVANDDHHDETLPP